MKPSIQSLLNEQPSSSYAHVPVELLNLHAKIQKFNRQRTAQSIQDVDQTLATYNAYCEALQSVHTFAPITLDWEKVKALKRPVEPETDETNEQQANTRLAKFNPTLFDKLFGTPQKELNRLENYVDQARFKDVVAYQQRVQRYKEELNTWMELQQLHNGFLHGDTKAFKDALHFFNPFVLVEALGAQLGFHIEEKKIDFDIYISPDTIMPDYEFNRMSTDALLKCKLSKKSFNTLLKNHISSVALKIARETFNLIPMKEVRVTVYFKSVDETQQNSQKCVMSVLFPADKVGELDFGGRDLNGLFIEFRHELLFDAYRGFEPVVKVPFTDELPNIMSWVN